MSERIAILLVFGLLVAAPVTARAQAPAGEWSRAAAGWYIGFGVGAGSGWIDDGHRRETQNGGGLAMFKVGGMLNDNFLVGFEYGAWRYEDERRDAVQYNHYDAMLTWFPDARMGGFLKAGFGFGNTVIQVRGETWGRSESGADLRLGGGWEFRLGKSFHLGVEAVAAATGHKHDVTTGDTGLLLTFSWY